MESTQDSDLLKSENRRDRRHLWDGWFPQDPVWAASARQVAYVVIARACVYTLALLVHMLMWVSGDGFISWPISAPWLGVCGLAYLSLLPWVWFFDALVSRPRVMALTFGLDLVLVGVLVVAAGLTGQTFLAMALTVVVLAGFTFGMLGGITAAVAFGAVSLGATPWSQDGWQAPLLSATTLLGLGFLSGALGEQLSDLARGMRRLARLHGLVVDNVNLGLFVLSPSGDCVFSNPSATNMNQATGGGLLAQVRGAAGQGPSGELGSSFEWDFVEGQDIRHFRGRIFNLPQGDRVAFVEDVTDARKLETQLRQREKLAAVGALASGIAHEIRNPLASISGSIQLLQGMGDWKLEESQKLTRIVLREIDRLNGLISEFLDYVRPENTRREIIDLRALAQEVLDMVKLNVQVRSDVRQSLLGPERALILGDVDKLKQAMLNILLNAYQAMEKNSAPPEIRVEIQTDPGRVVLVIEDNGPGMTEKVLSRLFEPFHTTKPKGTGLGLAVTHKIIENHSARIFVRSQLGQGSQFRIEFTELPLSITPPKIEKGRAS